LTFLRSPTKRRKRWRNILDCGTLCLDFKYREEIVILAEALSPLADWANFYVIVGSSAGALTGLQFVVIALIAEAEAAGSMLEIRAFGTPTVVHFCAALLVSAIISAPWHVLSNAGVILGVVAGAGIVYALLVIRHAKKQTGYSPDNEDWMWYAGLPLIAYAALAASAVSLERHPAPAMFVIGGITLLLLFVGIHNAWDTVTYVAVKRWQRSKKTEE
jgi:hypothetical protein